MNTPDLASSQTRKKPFSSSRRAALSAAPTSGRARSCRKGTCSAGAASSPLPGDPALQSTTGSRKHRYQQRLSQKQWVMCPVPSKHVTWEEKCLCIPFPTPPVKVFDENTVGKVTDIRACSAAARVSKHATCLCYQLLGQAAPCPPIGCEASTSANKEPVQNF